jgi:hypothetical protein
MLSLNISGATFPYRGPCYRITVRQFHAGDTLPLIFNLDSDCLIFRPFLLLKRFK